MKAFAVIGASLLTLLVHAQYPGAKRVPDPWKTGFNSIKEPDAKRILSYLAGKELRGRGSLSPDYFAAAGYVANELREMGLAPAGEGDSYFQRFDLVRATSVADGTSLESADGALKISYGNDFQTGWLNDATFKVKFAFVNVPEKADLAGFDWGALRGRVVLYSQSTSRNTAFTSRIADARESLGIEQLVYANQDRLSGAPYRITGVKDFPDPRNGAIGGIRLSKGAARKVGEKLGVTKFFTENPTEISIETPGEELIAKIKVSTETFPLVNVIAKIEGSDPALKSEFVTLGSHLDHMGPSNDGVRYGADDNASGCTANLLIAKALLSNPVKPKRSVLFCFWAAEEVGVFGSYAFVAKPTVPTSSMIAYVNMDMLGRNEETGVEIAENNTDVVYPGSVLTNSLDFYNRLVANNAFVNLRFKPDKTDRTHRSDTRNFVWKNIPTVKIFTGEHPDYHRAGDTIDKINWTKLLNISKWLYLSVADLATAADKPRFAKVPFQAPDHYTFAGRALFSEKVLLPTRARLIVELVDASGSVIATKDFPNSQGRTPFELLVPKTSLKEGGKYQIRMRIAEGDRVWFQSSSQDVAPTGWTRAQEINLSSPK